MTQVRKKCDFLPLSSDQEALSASVHFEDLIAQIQQHGNARFVLHGPAIMHAANHLSGVNKTHDIGEYAFMYEENFFSTTDDPERRLGLFIYKDKNPVTVVWVRFARAKDYVNESVALEISVLPWKLYKARSKENRYPKTLQLPEGKSMGIDSKFFFPTACSPLLDRLLDFIFSMEETHLVEERFPDLRNNPFVQYFH